MKLFRRRLTFLRFLVDGLTEPSLEPLLSASNSLPIVLSRGLLFSMVKPEAYMNRNEFKKMF